MMPPQIQATMAERAFIISAGAVPIQAALAERARSANISRGGSRIAKRRGVLRVIGSAKHERSRRAARTSVAVAVATGGLEQGTPRDREWRQAAAPRGQVSRSRSRPELSKQAPGRDLSKESPPRHRSPRGRASTGVAVATGALEARGRDPGGWCANANQCAADSKCSY